MNLLRRSCLFSARCRYVNQSSTSRIPRLITLGNTRSFLLLRKLAKMERIEKKYRIKDKMPSSTILVYNNPSAFWIEPLFHFQNLFLIGGFGYTIYLLRKYLNGEIEFPLLIGDHCIAKKPTEAMSFIAITGFVLLFSSFVCKFSVLRLYYDKATNVNKAVLVGYFPFLKKVYNIKARSIVPVKRRFPVKEFRTFEYKANGYRILLYENYFRRPEDLNKMIKYD